MKRCLLFCLISVLFAVPFAAGQQPSTVFPGTVTFPQQDNNPVYVDGTVNTTLAAAANSASCVGSNSGCNIVTDRPEVIHYMPGYGGRRYQINLSKGSPGGAGNGHWWTTVPIISSSD